MLSPQFVSNILVRTGHISQEDADKDFAGDACSVPEPIFGGALLIGVGWVAVIARRRRGDFARPHATHFPLIEAPR